MRLVLTSDLHGALPDIPPCDLLIVGGDVCPVTCHEKQFQREWIEAEYKQWLLNTPSTHQVWIAGNHDFVLEGWHPTFGRYLQDEEANIDGLRIYGLPWTPRLRRWAFHSETAEYYEAMPADLDILITHGPPYGYGDRCADGHVGSEALLEVIKEKNPKLIVTGHIHEGYGSYRLPNGSYMLNVAHMDGRYNPVNGPVSMEFEPGAFCSQ